MRELLQGNQTITWRIPRQTTSHEHRIRTQTYYSPRYWLVLRHYQRIHLEDSDGSLMKPHPMPHQEKENKVADSWNVIVCDRCFTASCWYGRFMCNDARSAGTRTMTAGQLRALGTLESESNWSPQTYLEVYGQPSL